MLRHIIMHLYQPTLGNTAFPEATFGARAQFPTSEGWFRVIHSGGMVQLIIEGSIQSLKMLWDKADKSSESEVLHILDPFHPLGSDTMDKAEQHTTCSTDSYPEKGHYIMAPHLPDKFNAIVNQMTLEETAHAELELVATYKAQKALKGEAGKSENFVQEIFEIDFRLTFANFYGKQTDSTSVCSLCDPGVVLVQPCTLSQDLC